MHTKQLPRPVDLARDVFAAHDFTSSRGAVRKNEMPPLSFRDAAQKYLQRLEHEGGKDLKMKATRLNLHLAPYFGDTPLSSITPADVERYRAARLAEPAIKSNSRGQGRITHKDRGTSEATVNREQAVLSHMLNKAQQWGWIERPSGWRLPRYRETQGRIRPLTVDQAKRLVECAKADRNPQIHLFVLIGLRTAMRTAEILSIRRDHLDLDRGSVHVPSAKTGPREQPIPADLAAYLREYLRVTHAGSEWLFHCPHSATGHTMTVRKAFRRIVSAAGLDPDQVVRHTLRQTAVTHLLQAGVDLPTVQVVSGYKSIAMVERFARANDSRIQDAADKLDSRYRGAGD